jgi:hypothetical protein
MTCIELIENFIYITFEVSTFLHAITYVIFKLTYFSYITQNNNKSLQDKKLIYTKLGIISTY